MLLTQILKNKLLLSAIIAIGSMGLFNMPIASAGINYRYNTPSHHWRHGVRYHYWRGHPYRYWHDHYYHRGSVVPAAFLGATLGVLAGAAIASSNHTAVNCRREYVSCHNYKGYWGPYRRCTRTVRYVC